MVQEIFFNGLMTGLFGFAGAWQLYLTFTNNLSMSRFYLGEGEGSQTGFLCPTNNYDNTVHCRLWQTQLVGCLACTAIFAIVTLVWIVLFRRRPLAFKDLPESLKENEMITSPRMEEAAKREEEQDRREEIAAIAAEAERRAALSRVKPQTRPTHPYQQQSHQQYPVSRVAAPAHLQHQNSASYLNQGYDSRESPLPQSSYSNDDGETYYNSNYAQQQQAYEMSNTNQHGYGRLGGATPAAGPGLTVRAGTPLGNPYSEDPLALAGMNLGINTTTTNSNTGYYPVTAPSTSQMQHAAAYNDNINNNEYAYGEFTPDETFDDPSSQEAQAHLAYANQLREQQLYHEQMAEALQKQKQQRAVKQQQHSYDESGVPHSGSTTNFYPVPNSHSSSMPPVSNGSTNIVAGGNSTSGVTAAPLSRRSADFASAAAYTRPPNTSSSLQHSGMITPGGSNVSGTRIAGSPQLYDDTATVPDSQYSYDRYRAEVLGDLRPPNTRAATAPGAPQESPGSESSGYHDYKVQVSSPVADPNRISTSSSNGAGFRTQTQGYVPPPTKSRTMWS
ncbi:hypothetical protein BG015_006486 [Linnemannia schmuckeri]|uniref:Uncharacterized protein n=1 Tax=Linnemannia schmuckeri TaxID=64567 RepID=A0A9P5RZN1_9FUNG|nr:hypothetical protein BG015_006486 [Linnemannia schmuckeri]